MEAKWLQVVRHAMSLATLDIFDGDGDGDGDSEDNA